jgi:hypothetical protein
VENPFESGHIRNYILFYAGIVLIMILFFFASSLFNDVEVVKKKVFNYDTNATKTENIQVEVEKPRRFKLLEKAY